VAKRMSQAFHLEGRDKKYIDFNLKVGIKSKKRFKEATESLHCSKTYV